MGPNRGSLRCIGLLTGRPDVVVHRLAGLFRQFEPDRPPGLFLAYGRAIAGITIRRNVLDPESDDIAAPQLAVDGQIRLSVGRSEVASSLASTFASRDGGGGKLGSPLIFESRVKWLRFWPFAAPRATLRNVRCWV